MGELEPWEKWLAKQVQPRKPRRVPSRAQRAAIEASLRVYLKLSCTHYTTKEEQEAVIARPPRRGVYWCSECQEWLELQPKPVRPVLPDVPEF